MGITATAPSLDSPPAKKLRGLWRPRFVSTWIVIFLAACAAIVTELPGWRAGVTQYAHGWPLAYLERDYENDSKVTMEIMEFTQKRVPIGHGGKIRLWNGRIPVNGLTTVAGDSGDPSEIAWKAYGLPWSIEQVMQPWSTANETSFSVWRAAIDLSCVVVLAFALGWIYQARRARGRRLWQFRLRTALVATAVIAICCAWAAEWRNQLRREHQLVEEIQKAGASNATVETGWLPPGWLPDCIAKLGIFGDQFQRVTVCQLTASDIPLPDLRAFKFLRSLNVASNYVTTAELTTLKALPCLNQLYLDNNLALTEADCASIADVKSLAELRAYRAPPEALSRLRALPHLQSLELTRVDSAEEIESIDQLKQLEYVNVRTKFSDPVRLHNLPKLGELSLVADVEPTGGFPPPVQELQLESLPQLTSLTATGFHVRLADVPQLRSIELVGGSLDSTAVRQLQQCGNLYSLSLKSFSFERGKPFEIRDMRSLGEIDLEGSDYSSARFENLPSLQTMSIARNGQLRSLEFRNLPNLAELEVTTCPYISSLDVGELANLDTLDFSVTAELTTEPSNYDTPDRSRRIPLAGLARLGKLQKLDLGGIALDRRTIADIATLAELKSLRLPATRLDDHEVLQLAPLSRLRILEISGNAITDASLAIVDHLQQLEEIWINETLVSHAAVKTLSARFPHVSIQYDWEQNAQTDLKTLADQARRGRRSIISLCTPYVWGRYLGDRDFRQLNGLDDLGWLSLSETHLTDAGLESLSGLDGVQSLDLSSTEITDAGLAALPKFSELRQLNLAHTRVRGEKLQYLRSLKNLKVLDLSDTDVTDESLDQLRFAPRIERLSLAGTQITDAGLSRLRQLPNLRVLDLKWTNLSPAGLAELRQLRRLDTLQLGFEGATHGVFAGLNSLPQLRTLEIRSGLLAHSDVDSLVSLDNVQVLVFLSNTFAADDLRRIVSMPSLREFWFLDSSLPNAYIGVLREAPRGLRTFRVHEAEDTNNAVETWHELPRLRVEAWDANTSVFDRRESDNQNESTSPGLIGPPPPRVTSPGTGGQTLPSRYYLGTQ